MAVFLYSPTCWLASRAPRKPVPRALRGGYWNNSPDNAHAGNRNNNIGFRVLSSVHITVTGIRQGEPTKAGRTRSGTLSWRGRGSGIGRLHKPGVAWMRSRSAFSSRRWRVFQPPVEQPTDFCHQAADLFVLAIVQPVRGAY